MCVSERMSKRVVIVDEVILAMVTDAEVNSKKNRWSFNIRFVRDDEGKESVRRGYVKVGKSQAR